MTHSTLLTLLLTTPFAAAVLPLAQRLLPHLQQIARLLEDFRTQPVTPAATRDFELRLQELLRHVGLDLTDWTFNHLEPGPLPERLHHDGQRYRRRDPSPNTIATLCGPVCLWRQLYEDLEPGNPCLFPLERRLGVVAGAATPALAERLLVAGPTSPGQHAGPARARPRRQLVGQDLTSGQRGLRRWPGGAAARGPGRAGSGVAAASVGQPRPLPAVAGGGA